MAEATNSLEVELLLARVKAREHESSLIMEVVRLQRTRIVQLENQLQAEKRYRQAHQQGTGLNGCRNCGLPTQYASIFCNRQCWREWNHRQKEQDTVNVRRGTRREDTVQRKEDAA
jgi:ribosomal protein S14